MIEICIVGANYLLVNKNYDGKKLWVTKNNGHTKLWLQKKQMGEQQLWVNKFFWKKDEKNATLIVGKQKCILEKSRYGRTNIMSGTI